MTTEHQGVIARASVNKNTFYYHFDNIDALAKAAIHDALPREIAKVVLFGKHPRDIRLSDDPLLSQEAALLPSSNGSALRPVLAREMTTLWESLIRDNGVATDAERSLVFSFVANGLIGAMGDAGPENARETLSALLIQEQLTCLWLWPSLLHASVPYSHKQKLQSRARR